MSDRTYFQACIYACPEDQRHAVVEVLAEYALEQSSMQAPFSRMVEEEFELVLDDSYRADEITCGTAKEMAGKLIEAAPGVSFVLWEDPKYDWLGGLVAYTPELGRYPSAEGLDADCSADGSVVLSFGDITAIMEDEVKRCLDTGDAPQFKQALAREMGEPWFEDWHRAGEVAAGG